MKKRDTTGIEHDLHITEVTKTPNDKGRWVSGTIDGHLFSVFFDGQVIPDWQMNNTRMSRLWLHRLADNQTVFRWHYGQCLPAADDRAKAVVDFLADRAFTDLAESSDPRRVSYKNAPATKNQVIQYIGHDLQIAEVTKMGRDDNVWV